MIALSELTEAEREDFAERAAIREFSGKQGRAAAERGALEDVLRQRGTGGWREAAEGSGVSVAAVVALGRER